MYDALTIAGIVDKLDDQLVDARIQRVQHLDELTIGFEVYGQRQRRWLVLSADSQHSRLLLQDERTGGDPELVTPILLLLRKHARGGKFVAITQPRHERVVIFSIARPLFEELSDDDDETDIEFEHHDLIFEMMGRHANLILVDSDGRIRDAIKRVPPAMSRVRPVLPGRDYVPPPPQDKLDPLTARPTDILDAAQGSDVPLSRWLVGAFLSVSPTLAREAVHRAGLEDETRAGDLELESCEAIIAALAEIFAPLNSGAWEPYLYQFEDGRTDFAAIRLLHLAERDDVQESEMPSVLDAAEKAWELARVSEEHRHSARRERLLAAIADERERVAHRLYSLNQQLEHAADPDDLRVRGEMIYAYIWMIEPGTDAIETPDGLRIDLDPDLTPQENAQEYFERYRKAQSAIEQLPALIRTTERELEYLDQLSTMTEQAQTFDEIEALRSELDEHRGPNKSGKQKKRSKSRSGKLASYKGPGGTTILVGRTSAQNDRVTFDIATQDDLWLHARDLPGAHVVLRGNGRRPDEKAIEIAASLAAYYSKGRGATRVPVDVTERRHVRKIKGAGPGMVTYRNETTLNVEPKSEDELGLTATQ